MSVRALNFLENWIDDNVMNRPFAGRAGPQAATRLVERMLAEAEHEGIPETEFEEAVGDLERFMLATLTNAAPSKTD